jgi:hypothetical protein
MRKEKPRFSRISRLRGDFEARIRSIFVIPSECFCRNSILSSLSFLPANVNRIQEKRLKSGEIIRKDPEESGISVLNAPIRLI